MERCIRIKSMDDMKQGTLIINRSRGTIVVVERIVYINGLCVVIGSCINEMYWYGERNSEYRIVNRTYPLNFLMREYRLLDY